jgi:DNA end-binding protein Ku
MRSIWKGSIGFGLVNIPIKLYPGVDDKRQEIALHNYHITCKTRIQQPKFCPTCNKLVEKEELVKGYELDNQNFVPITEEDQKRLPLNSIRSLQVVGFMKGELEDPRWVKDHYLISPDEVGVKAFVLFVQAMQELGVIGITKITLKTKEQLAAVRPFDGLLLLQTLHWGDELRNYDELSVSATVSDREMEMAKQLISGMTSEIDLFSFKDEYRKAFGELVAAKLAGVEIELPTPEKKEEVDLLEALERSLEVVPAGTVSSN